MDSGDLAGDLRLLLCIGAPQLGCGSSVDPINGLPGFAGAGAELHPGDLPESIPGQWNLDRFCRLGLGHRPHPGGGPILLWGLAAALALSDLEPGGHLRDLADAETQPLKLVGDVDAVGDAGRKVGCTPLGCDQRDKGLW